METLSILEEFVVNEIIGDDAIKCLSPEDDLLNTGIIDSMAVLKLILFLEKTFSIEVKSEDIVPENFQSLGSIVEYVQSVQG